MRARSEAIWTEKPTIRFNVRVPTKLRANGNRTGFVSLLILCIAFLVSGCTTALVKVTQPIIKDVPVYSEWTAATKGNVNAVIRAQIQGYLVSRSHKEGGFVQNYMDDAMVFPYLVFNVPFVLTSLMLLFYYTVWLVYFYFYHPEKEI